MPCLDLEKRTGVKDSEINDFVGRADAVQKKIQDMISGKISVEDIEAEHAKEAAEKAAHEAKKAAMRADYERREREKKERDAAEEHERWWSGADLLYPLDGSEGADDSIQTDADGNSQRDLLLRKYEMDYSRWSDSALT